MKESLDRFWCFINLGRLHMSVFWKYMDHVIQIEKPSYRDESFAKERGQSQTSQENVSYGSECQKNSRGR